MDCAWLYQSARSCVCVCVCVCASVCVSVAAVLGLCVCSCGRKIVGFPARCHQCIMATAVASTYQGDCGCGMYDGDHGSYTRVRLQTCLMASAVADLCDGDCGCGVCSGLITITCCVRCCSRQPRMHTRRWYFNSNAAMLTRYRILGAKVYAAGV